MAASFLGQVLPCMNILGFLGTIICPCPLATISGCRFPLFWRSGNERYFVWKSSATVLIGWYCSALITLRSRRVVISSAKHVDMRSWRILSGRKEYLWNPLEVIQKNSGANLDASRATSHPVPTGVVSPTEMLQKPSHLKANRFTNRCIFSIHQDSAFTVHTQL